MNHHFGPWVTWIRSGPNPQLSAFWRRRLVQLPGLSRVKPAVTRFAASSLVLTALSVVALPTLSVKEVSAEPRHDPPPASPAVKPRSETGLQAPRYTQVAILHYGGGLTGQGGSGAPTGYTILAMSKPNASKTEVAISFAYEQGSLGRTKYRLVAMDKQQKIHEATDEASVMGGGSKLCVMTLTAEFPLREKDIDKLIVQKYRE